MQINHRMTSSRPYLLRAINDWIIDNELTPHMVVDATANNVVVPRQYVDENKIVLNISPAAVSHFHITNEFISFSARFSGKAMEIFVPVTAVLALYAKENGQGMVFNEERVNFPQGEMEEPQTSSETVSPDTDGAGGNKSGGRLRPATSRRPSLKLVD